MLRLIFWIQKCQALDFIAHKNNEVQIDDPQTLSQLFTVSEVLWIILLIILFTAMTEKHTESAKEKKRQSTLQISAVILAFICLVNFVTFISKGSP